MNNKCDKTEIKDFRDLSSSTKGEVWISAENNIGIEELKKAAESIDKMHSGKGPSQISGKNRESTSRDQRDPLGRVPPGQGSSPGGDVGLPTDRDITKARKIAKELYKKAEKSLEGSIERKYVDSLLDWY